MSLFNDASIVQIPSGYKASTLYSIKPSSGAGDFSVVRATTATRVNENGLIESVAANVPRIDYTNGGCGELLVEPQRTNLLTYSEQFDNVAWTKIQAGTGIAPVVTANAGVAPDGTTTADRVQFNAGAGGTSSDISILRQLNSLSSGDASTTIYVKSNTGSTQYINLLYAGNTVEVAIGNSWTRLSEVVSLPSVGTAYGLTLAGDNTDTTSDLLVWGAQLEEGGYATSYIPTVASAVTRNADVISKTGIASLIGQSEGTLFFEFDLNNITTGLSQYIGVISDGTASNRIQFLKNPDNNFQVFISSTGASNISIEESTSGVGTYKVAIAYRSGDIAFYVNGVQEATSSSAIDFSTLTDFDLGQRYDDIFQLENPIKQAALYKTRLTNDELAALTS